MNIFQLSDSCIEIFLQRLEIYAQENEEKQQQQKQLRTHSAATKVKFYLLCIPAATLKWGP